MYLRETILCAATLRQKLQIKLAILPSHSKLIPGQPVLVLTLYRQMPGRVATRIPLLKSPVGLKQVKAPGGKAGLSAVDVVCCLLNVPATYECISGTELLRQFYMLPH